MRFQLISDGDDKCALCENTPSCSLRWVVPVPRDVLIDGIVAFVREPEKRDHTVAGVVKLDRTRDGIRVAAGVGYFVIPYAHALALVIPEVAA